MNAKAISRPGFVHLYLEQSPEPFERIVLNSESFIVVLAGQSSLIVWVSALKSVADFFVLLLLFPLVSITVYLFYFGTGSHIALSTILGAHTLCFFVQRLRLWPLNVFVRKGEKGQINAVSRWRKRFSRDVEGLEGWGWFDAFGISSVFYLFCRKLSAGFSFASEQRCYVSSCAFLCYY